MSAFFKLCKAPKKIITIKVFSTGVPSAFYSIFAVSHFHPLYLFYHIYIHRCIEVYNNIFFSNISDFLPSIYTTLSRR